MTSDELLVASVTLYGGVPPAIARRHGAQAASVPVAFAVTVNGGRVSGAGRLCVHPLAPGPDKPEKASGASIHCLNVAFVIERDNQETIRMYW